MNDTETPTADPDPAALEGMLGRLHGTAGSYDTFEADPLRVLGWPALADPAVPATAAFLAAMEAATAACADHLARPGPAAADLVLDKGVLALDAAARAVARAEEIRAAYLEPHVAERVTAAGTALTRARDTGDPWVRHQNLLWARTVLDGHHALPGPAARTLDTDIEDTRPGAAPDVEAGSGPCPGCGTAAGLPHHEGCPVAACSVCGLERNVCDHGLPAGPDVRGPARGPGDGGTWTGRPPGDAEVEEGLARDPRDLRDKADRGHLRWDGTRWRALETTGRSYAEIRAEIDLHWGGGPPRGTAGDRFLAEMSEATSRESVAAATELTARREREDRLRAAAAPPPPGPTGETWQVLAAGIENLSETCYCAGWAGGIEHQVWAAATTRRGEKLGQATWAEVGALVDALHAVAERTGQWVEWDDATGPRPVELPLWKVAHEARNR